MKKPTLKDNKRFIQNHLSEPVLWGQLAEEAAELSQAALKMQRVLCGVNPPRATWGQCQDAVVEEQADVILCLELLDMPWSEEHEAILTRKAQRWADHLLELEVQED